MSNKQILFGLLGLFVVGASLIVFSHTYQAYWTHRDLKWIMQGQMLSPTGAGSFANPIPAVPAKQGTAHPRGSLEDIQQQLGLDANG